MHYMTLITLRTELIELRCNVVLHSLDKKRFFVNGVGIFSGVMM